MMATEQAPRDLHAGAASIAITPTVGVAMQGYGERYATAVGEPLVASALAVGRGRVEWLLLSVDCIGLDRSFTTRVRQALATERSLASTSIMIACSHTHSGPATLPRLGPVGSDDAYLDFLEERLIAVTRTAVGRLQPSRWRLGVTSFAENVNRRERRGERIELGVDPRGPVDTRLRVIRIDSVPGAGGQGPLALIVHYACHATASSNTLELSGDWPGAMRSALQGAYRRDGAEPVVCFLQGCAGDVTHRIGRDPKAWPEHFGQQTSVQSQLLGRLAAAAALGASERAVNIAGEHIATAVEPLNLSFADGSPSERSELQLVRIGAEPGPPRSGRDAVWIVGLPGEPFTDYGTALGRQFDARLGARRDNVLVSGYTNDCVGYFCTAAALREGGYEAAVAHRMYHRPAPFAAGTQAVIVNRSLAAAARLAGQPSTRARWRFVPELVRRRRWPLRSAEGNAE